MNELSWDFVFREKIREWIRIHLDLEKTLRAKLELFSKSPFHPDLGTRRIAGPGEAVYGFPINDEYVLVFVFIDQAHEKPVLVDIVGRSDLAREDAAAGRHKE
jgi:plasmid maintenance system killer protein